MDHVLNQPMAEAESHEEAITKFPLDRNAYHILDEIGRGVSAVVYKAICVPVNLALVAIKAIDLDRGSHSTATTNLDNIRLETKTMSLLSHPNILSAHCSFTVNRRLWVVMPFMSAGSVQSIISSSFPTGLPEPCIAVVLKDTLNALSYLHDQGHIHRDIKAGNILIDSNGSVKLADFGVSASVYDKNSALGSSFFLTDVAGTPYWMAPEVIHSHNGYGFKADIWSFGITALELAHGGPPLSNLPPSKSLLLKITKRFRFSDYEKGHKTDKNYKHKKFSKAFKDMVGLCLQQDPTKRPSADKLLKHSFFKNCKLGSDFLVKNVVQALPSVEDRFKETMTKIHGGHEEREEDDEAGDLVRQRRISGWNFNEDGFDLDPILFPFSATESTQGDSLVKMVRFGGETIFHIQDESNPSSPGQLGEEEDQVGGHSEEINVSDESIVEDRGGESGESLESNPSSPGEVEEEGMTQLEVGGCSEMNVGEFSNYSGVDGGVDREAMVGSLVGFVRSLDDQRQNVMTMIGMLQGGEEGSNWEVPVSREEQMGQVIERMRSELESERERNFQLEMELEFLRIQISGTYNNAAAAGIH